MSAAKHTPGPWQVVCHSWHASSVYSKDMDTIATCLVRCVDGEPADGDDGDDEALKDANARLIAAAPELLEALKLAYRNLNGGTDSLTATEHLEAFRLARAAIAKATGEQA